MNIEPILSVLHVTAVITSYISAYYVFINPKGGKQHKKIGKIYAVAMLTVALSGFGIYESSGTFSIFHFFSIVTITSITLGWVSIIRYVKTKNPSWLIHHYFNMCYSFMGLNLAALAQAMRGMTFHSLNEYYLTVLVTYLPVILLARWLIRKKLMPTMIRRYVN